MLDIREIAERYIIAGWQHGDLEALGSLLAPAFENHGSNGGGATRPEFTQGIAELFTGLPDFFAAIEDIIVDPAQSKAAIRWTGTGTHTGVMMQMSPTGRSLTFRGIDIIRVENGRIAERWGESNASEVFSYG